MISFAELESLIEPISIYERREIELYYFMYKLTSNESTLDEFNQYYNNVLYKTSHRKIHVLRSAEIYAIAGDKDSATKILRKYRGRLEDADQLNVFTLTQCIMGSKPEFDPLLDPHILISCAYLVPGYNPVKDFLKLDPNERLYSQFLQELVLNNMSDQVRKDLVEEGIRMLRRVKEEEALITDAISLAIALRKMGDERYKDYLEMVNRISESRSELRLMKYQAFSMYHATFNERDEMEQAFNDLMSLVENFKKSRRAKDRETYFTARFILALTSLGIYYANKEDRYLNIALDVYRSLESRPENTLKWSLLYSILRGVNKLELVMSLIKDVVDQDPFNEMFLFPLVASSLSDAYINMNKDDKLIRNILSIIESYGIKIIFIKGFLKGLACRGVSRKLNVQISFC
ncbi:hypothetical protein [Metallosphaera hakonensis]|uniref:Uncharacterized protein n=1 Tax=Metallosphaera hakonensis JCM 8857 = DSM 7519 TaxID=1293036 RepID=A0A2U9IR66_9CREN|nr:hypothetical protein [Metallosphaera hakonensis]AWR98522.1 hypothetical protein DFR87_01035 [Metallosphaera hakonensis JCM 8857 = DSM 7519]